MKKIILVLIFVFLGSLHALNKEELEHWADMSSLYSILDEIEEKITANGEYDYSLEAQLFAQYDKSEQEQILKMCYVVSDNYIKYNYARPTIELQDGKFRLAWTDEPPYYDVCGIAFKELAGSENIPKKLMSNFSKAIGIDVKVEDVANKLIGTVIIGSSEIIFSGLEMVERYLGEPIDDFNEYVHQNRQYVYEAILICIAPQAYLLNCSVNMTTRALAEDGKMSEEDAQRLNVAIKVASLVYFDFLAKEKLFKTNIIEYIKKGEYAAIAETQYAQNKAKGVIATNEGAQTICGETYSFLSKSLSSSRRIGVNSESMKHEYEARKAAYVAMTLYLKNVTNANNSIPILYSVMR